MENQLIRTTLRSLVQLTPHGDMGGFINFAGTATCTDCHQVRNNEHFMFYKNRINPDTKLCLYVNKKCDVNRS